MEIAISELVDLQEGTTSDTISRKDGKLFASVSAEITTKDVAKASTASGNSRQSRYPFKFREVPQEKLENSIT